MSQLSRQSPPDTNLAVAVATYHINLSLLLTVVSFYISLIIKGFVVMTFERLSRLHFLVMTQIGITDF